MWGTKNGNLAFWSKTTELRVLHRLKFVPLQEIYFAFNLSFQKNILLFTIARSCCSLKDNFVICFGLRSRFMQQFWVNLSQSRNAAGVAATNSQFEFYPRGSFTQNDHLASMRPNPTADQSFWANWALLGAQRFHNKLSIMCVSEFTQSVVMQEFIAQPFKMLSLWFVT